MGKMRNRLLRGVAVTGISAAMVLGLGGPGSTETTPKQVVTGPVAQYWIDTTTSSGFNMSGLQGGGRPSMSSMMNMMNGGAQHTMSLRLGSSQTATGEAQGDHLPPATLDAGADLPLYYKAPVVTSGPSQPRDDTPSTPETYEAPKGKILIFWGCGEHAPAGQPVVIDLAKITDPAQRTTLMRQMAPSVTLETVNPPLPSHFKSFGEWPNVKSKTGLDSNSSLVGAHTVKANYAPNIAFTLDQSQDFLAPIQVSGNQKSASGAVPLTWAAIPGAKGFVATVIGGSKDVVVMWTSAASQTGWMGVAPDYMTPGDIARLTASKVLLPGTATGCTVPSEVAKATEGAMYGVTAYGGETNLSYPARPADPKVAWNIQWTTKIRYRSTTGGMLGQDMGGMGGMGGTGMFGGSHNDDDTATAPSGNEQPQQPPQQGDDGKKKKKKGSLFGEIVKQGVGSLIP